MATPLISVHHLSKYFPIKSDTFFGKKLILKAVDDISFDLYPSETLGVVGESGCGKSTVGKTILRLYEKDGGDVFYNGKDIFSLSKDELKMLRKHMQMGFVEVRVLFYRILSVKTGQTKHLFGKGHGLNHTL